MIDSHCHIDRCKEPEAAADPSLRALVTVGTSTDRNDDAIALAGRYDNVFAAVGIHPNNASDADRPEVRETIGVQASHAGVVAIGETGFDSYWDNETLASQRRAFSWQASLAEALGKALIVHVRDGNDDDRASQAAAESIAAAGHRRGVLHCFNGHPALLETGLDLGWMVSFAGNLTYRSAGRLREVAAVVPKDRLLVETDSPYLTPVPLRGRPNVPANVRYTAAVLADLRGVPLAELEPILDANAVSLYGLPDTAD